MVPSENGFKSTSLGNISRKGKSMSIS